MSKAFLGTGWRLNVAADDDGRIHMASGEESVRQAIWIILSTAPGERLMRPDFGCGIHDLVFAVSDAGAIGRATSLVQQALTRWEPRIDVLHVGARPDPAHSALLLIEIVYALRTTNSRFNLVYPFYME